jgi:hypothetical protein
MTFWAPESYIGRESVRNGRGAASKDDGYFDANPDMRNEEWKSRLLRCIEAG